MKETPEAEYGGAPMQCEATRLMLAAKNGDARAFDRLVESLRGRAFHVACSLVGSRDDAMELTQEAFLKVYKARETFRDGEPFLPWFHRILRNACYSFLRDRGKLRARSISARIPGADEDAADLDLQDDEATPLDSVESGERAEIFWKAFRTLSGRDREILSLRHFEELTHAEAATVLDIGEAAAAKRYVRALKRLKDVLNAL